MRTLALIGLSLPALLSTGATVAGASARDAAADARAVAEVAARAGKALGKRDAPAAVALAEKAVALSPRDAALRALLGRAYLQAGRFASARTMLEEALALDGRDGRAALSLVLARIAGGDWAAARATILAHADTIAADDYGLAVALSGDPAGGVGVLMRAARRPGAGPRTRQNLALALALAGQWGAAKAVAEADLSPADVDRRMTEWAEFARPRAASDQVAHLLGVRAAADAGRPAALALNAPAAPAVAVADAAPAPRAAPVVAKVVFAPPREVVQPLAVQSVTHAAKVAPKRWTQLIPAPAAPAKGTWFMQIGAFDSPEVARDVWAREARRFAAFRRLTPHGSHHRNGRRGFHQLSVGGFARADAVALCERYRISGGACFVRAGAGDRVAPWLRRPDARLAMR